MLIRFATGMQPERASGTLRSEVAARCSSLSAGHFCKRSVSFWANPRLQCIGIFKSSMIPSMQGTCSDWERNAVFPREWPYWTFRITQV